MSKDLQKNTTITINCENEETKNSVLEFFQNYKGQVIPLFQQLIQSQGLNADPAITVSGDEITVEQFPKDKGIVVASTDGKISVAEYTALKAGDKYLETIPQGLAVYVVQNDDADILIGHFRSLKDGLLNLESEAVNEAAQKAIAPKEEPLVEDAKVVEETDSEVTNG